MALTRDRIEQFIGESVARGELSTEQGKTLVEEMTQRAETERQKLESFVRVQVDHAMQAAGLVSRTELSRLEARISLLENRMRELSYPAARSEETLSSENGEGSVSRGGAPITLDPATDGPDLEGPNLPPHM